MYGGVQHVLTIRVTWWVFYERQDMITLRGTWVTLVFGGVNVAHVFSFIYCVFCLSSSCVLCTQSCYFLWIVHFRLPLRLSFSLRFWVPIWYNQVFVFNIIIILYIIFLQNLIFLYFFPVFFNNLLFFLKNYSYLINLDFFI